MSLAIAFALGAILSATAVWLLQRGERLYLRKELAIAQDRLLHAWRDDKAVIAPRPAEVVEEQKLPAELVDCVNEWESPEARATEESWIRQQYFGQGRTVLAIMKDRENRHPA